VVAVSWIYGADRLLDNIEMMTGNRPCIWWKICWKYISPVVILATFLYGVIQWDGVKYGSYTYPGWAEGIGWVMAGMSMICIPIGMIHAIWTTYRDQSYSPSGVETGFMQALRDLMKPDEGRLKEMENKRVKPHKNYVA